MKVIDQINGSALFAQSAYSASIATKDSLGRDITATYLTGINIPESATWNDVSTTYQSNSANYITAHQSLEGLMSASLLESADGKWTAYNSIPFKAGDEFPASADEAVRVVESNSSTWNETSNVVRSNSAQWAEGGTTYTSPSGTILINGDTLEGTNSAISIVGYEGFVSSYGSRPAGPNDTARYTWDKALPNTIITLDTRVNSRTLYWSANTDLTGETVLPETGITTLSISIPNATAFAAWSNKYFNLNGATVSAADTLGTTVGELAWASALPTYEYDNTNKISAINGSALAGGDMFTAYLEYNDQNQISGYAGSAFAGQGGGGNPEVENYVQTNSGTIDDTVTSFQTNSSTYMVEPNLEFNAVGEISGYGNSAIAQYGAEKQWLQHDDTIVHISNSAQYAFGCNISALQRLMGIDETVLYNNTAATTADVAIGYTFNISEPITNFNKFKIYYSRFSVTSNFPCSQIREYESDSCSSHFVINETFPTSTAQEPQWFDISMLIETISGTTWKCKACYQSELPNGTLDKGWAYLKPYKIVGIGRKQ